MMARARASLQADSITSRVSAIALFLLAMNRGTATNIITATSITATTSSIMVKAARAARFLDPMWKAVLITSGAHRVEMLSVILNIADITPSNMKPTTKAMATMITGWMRLVIAVKPTLRSFS